MNLTDVLFIVPAADLSRPREIATSATETVAASWLEPSGTQDYNGRRLVLCRFWRKLASIMEVQAVLALNGRENWEIVGIVDPTTGTATKSLSMGMAFPFMSPVVDQPGEYDDEGNEIAATTYRPVIVGNTSDFAGIGWFGPAGGAAIEPNRIWVL